MIDGSRATILTDVRPGIERRPVFFKLLTRAKIKLGMPVTRNSGSGLKMTLITDTLALYDSQVTWIHDRIRSSSHTDLRLMEIDMRLSWSVTFFTANGHFQKGRLLVPVGHVFHRRHATGVATETVVRDPTSESTFIVRSVSRRKIPFGCLRVPVQR